MIINSSRDLLENYSKMLVDSVQQQLVKDLKK